MIYSNSSEVEECNFQQVEIAKTPEEIVMNRGNNEKKFLNLEAVAFLDYLCRVDVEDSAR